MPTTKEQRSKHATCDALKKNGERCKNYAGLGTNHLGVGTCKFHLGRTQNAQKAAVKVYAERDRQAAQKTAILFGQELRMEPLEALLWSLHLSASHVNFIRQEIAAIPTNGPKPEERKFKREVLIRQFADERDRLARTSKMALDAGVAEKTIRMQERYAELLAQLISGILGDLALNPRQQRQAPEIVKRRLLALDGGSPEALAET